MTIEHDFMDAHPLHWKNLLFVEQKLPGPRDLLIGITLATSLSLGIVQLAPGTSAAMVFVVAAAHCCLMLALQWLV